MKISLSPRSHQGFTLIELIIVIAILATLAGIAYPTYMSMQENAGRTAAKKVCVDIVNAVERLNAKALFHPFSRVRLCFVHFEGLTPLAIDISPASAGF